MRRFFGAIGLVGLLLAVAAGTAAADEVQLTSSLSGSQEVGDPGDPEGTGSAVVDIDSDTNEVCFQINVSGTEDPVAAHIHEGGSGVNGDVVVDFDWATTAGSGCVTGDGSVVAAILADPSGYYVNVHTPEFPAGAVRGQLGGGGELAQTGTDLTLILFAAGAALIAVGGVFYIGTARARR